ncbi:hypothetical protein B0H15DRAFT_377677 [Mycena belliarum]|uniref:Uncharacterized protein n=1 Tax=Mycena belliarum TaxID=1033014 RepID=A0AAD6U1D8_9AGAR|nr:hypothetical protein B0H15DRAFT_377677 [Mycena belliae]
MHGEEARIGVLDGRSPDYRDRVAACLCRRHVRAHAQDADHRTGHVAPLFLLTTTPLRRDFYFRETAKSGLHIQRPTATTYYLLPLSTFLLARKPWISTRRDIAYRRAHLRATLALQAWESCPLYLPITRIVLASRTLVVPLCSLVERVVRDRSCAGAKNGIFGVPSSIVDASTVYEFWASSALILPSELPQRSQIVSALHQIQ